MIHIPAWHVLFALLFSLFCSLCQAAPSPEEMRHRTLVTKAAREARVEPALLMAIVKVESNFDHRARHPDGPTGLTQITPTTARSVQPGIRHADLLHPEKNLRVGARHLRELLDEFKDRRLAIAAYQAGTGRVKAMGTRILNHPHTGRHVNRVLQAYEGYRQQAAFREPGPLTKRDIHRTSVHGSAAVGHVKTAAPTRRHGTRNIAAKTPARR